MERSRRELLVSLGSVGVVGLAGCGGSGGEPTETDGPAEDEETQAQTATRAPTATLTPTATEVPPATDQTQRLAAESGSSISFGSAIAITGEGTTSVIGDSGTAYVFDTSDGSWSQQTTLTPDDGGSGFGADVDISDDGTTVVVGANTADEPNGNSAGAAYVFTQLGGEWSQQTKLAASEGSAAEEFGSAVALSGDGTTALLSAPLYTQGDDDDIGAAYAFTQSGGSWSQQARLTPPREEDTADGLFGSSVALAENGDRAVVGAPYADLNGGNSGAAYAFSRSGGSWSQEGELLPGDNAESDRLGSSVGVAADGATALVGARNDGGDVGNYNVGAAYIFEWSGSAWAEGAKITADDGEDLDHFGDAAALSGSGGTAVIGVPFDDDGGSAYVFTDDGEWTQDSKLTGDDNGNDDFGEAVTVSDDGGVAIVGAPDDEDPNGDAADGSIGGAGSAYVYD